jgi:hypothetical protein
MAELRTLRAERKAARDQALEEAVLLSQLAQSKGEKYDPAAGFPPEILGAHSLETTILRPRFSVYFAQPFPPSLPRKYSSIFMFVGPARAAEVDN